MNNDTRHTIHDVRFWLHRTSHIAHRTSYIKLFIFLSLSTGIAFGQSSGDSETTRLYEQKRLQVREQQQSTRSQIENLENQIVTYTDRLGTATEEHNEMFRQYEELTRIIVLQEERLRQMNREQRQIREEIDLVQQNQVELEQRLRELIEEYQDILTHVYKHGRTTELALILTSASIHQLVVRSYYLARFDRYRQAQTGQIRNTQLDLEQRKIDLQEAEERNDASLATIREEAENLEHQKSEQSQQVEQLKNDRDNLENQLLQARQQREALDNTLNNLMAEEEELRRSEEERLRLLAEASQIEDEEERREAEARYSTPVLPARSVSNEEIGVFEAQFRERKGQLPWPVENGTITERFGTRVHPVFGTRTQNLGVDIAVSSRSPVRVVNDGYVFRVEPLQGYGEVVFVNHGNYLTAYGNLSNIYARRNQVLQQGDVIGLSGDRNSIRGEVLFFLIRDGSQNVNPEEWLRRPVP